jgi:hypothetical protein
MVLRTVRLQSLSQPHPAAKSAVVTPQSPELNQILRDLQSALREHNERLRDMIASRDTHTEVRSTISEEIYRCAICGKAIMLEQAKVTEDRTLVHGKCYVEMIEGK